MSKQGPIRVFLAALVSCIPLLTVASPLRIEGIARSAAGQEVYRETHDFDGKAHRILYHDPAGALIAEKQLDYSCSDSAPDWQQHDLRNGMRVGGHWRGSEYVLEHDGRSGSVSPERTLVASSGFDHFVRDHWVELASGETREFDFALPARLSTIGMRVQKTQGIPGESSITEWFSVEPSSGIFRLFAGKILLGYDEARGLQFYRGPSNIGDAEGRDVEVEIRYQRVQGEAGLPELPLARTRGAPQSHCPGSDA